MDTYVNRSNLNPLRHLLMISESSDVKCDAGTLGNPWRTTMGTDEARTNNTVSLSLSSVNLALTNMDVC